MNTARDKTLIIALCAQAAVDAIASSAALGDIAPPGAVAIVALISGASSAATAMYVALTREPVPSPDRGTTPDRRSI